jgi:hypothetical protein
VVVSRAEQSTRQRRRLRGPADRADKDDCPSLDLNWTVNKGITALSSGLGSARKPQRRENRQNPSETKPCAPRRFQNRPASSSTKFSLSASTRPPPLLYARVSARVPLPPSSIGLVWVGFDLGRLRRAPVVACLLAVREGAGGRWRPSGSSRSSRTCRRIRPPPAAPVISRLPASASLLLPLLIFEVSVMNVNG